MIPFRRRNPVPLALGALATGVALVAAGLAVGELSFGATYSAAFAESAGLRPKEEVTIAGVRVGEVTAVELEGDHVRVDMRLDGNVRLGAATRAHIRIKTLLGSHTVALEPHGPGALEEQIPLTRTSVPYEIVPAAADLARSAGRIDTDDLRQAMTVLAQTLEGSSQEIRSSLAGLGRLSRTVASRDDKLHDLLRHASKVSGLLDERERELRGLVGDGDLLLREVAARRLAIHNLLVTTVLLTEQVDGLIADNRATLGPALKELRGFVAILRRNEQSLDRSLRLLAPFANQFVDAIGNGPWFDSIIQNLVPLPASLRVSDTQGPDLTLGGLTR